MLIIDVLESLNFTVVPAFDGQHGVLSVSGDRERALDAGCDDYLSKPINVPDLLEKITTLLAAKK